MISAFTIGLIAVIVIAILFAEPLYVLLGGVAAYLLLASGNVDGLEGLTIIVEMTRKLSDEEVLLAIPFFVISGAIMSEGDIARRLIAVAQSAFSWVSGGLAVSAVFACVFFAAISGSSPVTVIAIGSIMYPAMVKAGYRERFAGGLVTSAGSLGILIPPSIPMIVYQIIDPKKLQDPPNYLIAADAGGSDLKELFLAGMGPGFFIGAVLAAYAIFEGRRSRIDKTPFAAMEFVRALREGFWSLMLPVLILGGIYAGIFTPTQAAAVSVVYAVIVEFYIHKSLTPRDIPRIFSESTVLIGALLIIVALAQGFNKFLVLEQVAEHAANYLTDMQLSPIGFLLIVNLLLLVVGCFMDVLSAILILVPLLSPIAFELGIHPIHLGVIFIVNLEIGYLTPPLGLNLFVASTIFRKSLGEVVRSVIPFTALMLACLIAITYIPTISLGPVSAFNGHGFYVPMPERMIPMRRMESLETMQFLAGVAEREEEEADETSTGGQGDPGRPLTIEEIMQQTQQEMQREAMDAVNYDDLGALLTDFARIHNGAIRLQDLGVAQEIEDERNESEAADEGGGDSGADDESEGEPPPERAPDAP